MKLFGHTMEGRGKKKKRCSRMAAREVGVEQGR
jgi:hypothetical protein